MQKEIKLVTIADIQRSMHSMALCKIIDTFPLLPTFIWKGDERRFASNYGRRAAPEFYFTEPSEEDFKILGEYPGYKILQFKLKEYVATIVMPDSMLVIKF